MDKLLKQLRRRFIIVFMIIGGVFLLLAYGAIFIINIDQTLSGIDKSLTQVLDKTSLPLSEKEEWIQRTNCILLQEEKGAITVYNSGSLSTDEIEYIITRTLFAGDSAFEYDGRYYKSAGRSALGADIKVYAVYDYTSDRNDLFEAGMLTISVYLLCLILLFVFGLMVSRQVTDPIKMSYEQQKKLVADASHELKTPIAIIGANMSLVMSDKDSTIAENEHWFNNIDSQLKRMSALVADMLELHKADDAKSKPRTFEDISAMLNGVLLSFEARCFEKNIEMQENICEGVMTCCIKQNIERLYTIMMDNALKYTPEGGKIYVELLNDKKHLTLRFTNYGTGIEKEHLTKIFDRFYRVDSARTQNTQIGNSFGLGLSLAKSIVLDHEGTIECISDGKDYVTFEIKIPIKPYKSKLPTV